MADIPTKVVTGKTEVPTEQTPVQLESLQKEGTVREVYLQADPSNVGAICAVGDKNVNAKKTLGTTRGTVMEKKQGPVIVQIDDTAKLWVDVEKGKDFICWTAVVA